MKDAPLASRWLYALKPKSWPKLFAPALLGQAIGFADSGKLSWLAALVGALFTALDASLIVLLNDWGDREVDAIKRRRFPHACSPKTIPDGILSAETVLFGGLFAATVLVVLAFRAGPAIGRPALGPMSLVAVALFVAYTFPPARLNYRGGGELVEAVGVGLVLPGIHAYLQSGELASPRMIALAPSLLSLALASALASGLSDEESDREGGKRTFTTALGNRAVRLGVLLAVAAGILLLGASVLITRGGLAAPAALGALVLAAAGRPLIGACEGAVTGAFAEQNRFKAALHAGSWGAMAAMTAALVVQRALGLG
ncbi:MAG: prenyltransferase [Myxococcales bacterium]|jgi:1,4-dihydroxy-2-naphthoate octaprenyltransferase/chlorophyll synthase|nr:prenyltransferase [Myxococcales bacterium]